METPISKQRERERGTNHVMWHDLPTRPPYLWPSGEALLGWRVVNVPEIGPETSTQSHACSARRRLPHCWRHLRTASKFLCWLEFVSQIPFCRKESLSFIVIHCHSLSVIVIHCPFFPLFLPKRAEVEILLDLLVRAFLGFVVAALAASSAVKSHSKLHISMIRCLSAWCSTIWAVELNLMHIWGDGSCVYIYIDRYRYVYIYTFMHAYIHTYKHTRIHR